MGHYILYSEASRKNLSVNYFTSIPSPLPSSTFLFCHNIIGLKTQQSTPCPQKKYTVCILAITSSNLDQIQKVRWVLKSARSQLFKTVLTFEIWPSRSWENWGQRHQGSFSVFTFLCNFKPFFCVISTKKF